jgi:hypothetical protein
VESIWGIFSFLSSGRKGENRAEGGVLSGVKNGSWNPENASLCGAGPCITVHSAESSWTHGFTNRNEQEADSVSTPSVIVPSLSQERVQDGARVQSHEL